MRLALLLTLVAIMTVLTSCAAKGAGAKATIEIVSTPPGASAVLSSGERCVTPCVLSKAKSEDFFVTVSKEGYTPKKVKVRKLVAGFGGNTAGPEATATINKLWSGLVRYKPNPVSVTLEPSWQR